MDLVDFPDEIYVAYEHLADSEDFLIVVDSEGLKDEPDEVIGVYRLVGRVVPRVSVELIEVSEDSV